VTGKLTLLALLLQQPAPQWTNAPDLPFPTSNNAVVAVDTERGPAVFSFLGLDSTKLWSGIHSRSFRWTIESAEWTEVQAVPGRGRLAATAQAADGRVYLFSGYTVDADGSEKSLPNVDIYHPDTDTWSRGTDIPTPVDDAVSGVWNDSLIYLISGWHDSGNVSYVQIYDTFRDEWHQATPIPGPPVFGHTGSIVDNTIVYIDGAIPNEGSTRFVLEHSSWRGNINPDDPTEISWSRLEHHPGPPLYRAAAGTGGNRIVFAAGSDNPYNYNGIGYNGVASPPRDAVFAFDLSSGSWLEMQSLPLPSMDHRGIAVIDGRMVIVGGMGAGQEVLRRVTVGKR
jgi:N-acetylneuraminic acid mutarotase